MCLETKVLPLLVEAKVRRGGEALCPVTSSIAIHYGIDYERNYVAWCQWVIEQLEQQMCSEAS
jgi:hypothetical protein